MGNSQIKKSDSVSFTHNSQSTYSDEELLYLAKHGNLNGYKGATLIEEKPR